MNVQQIAVTDIIVPESRFRAADREKTTEIGESLKRFGQLQPIIIQQDNVLVDGLHRLTAAQQAGITTLSAVYRDEVDELFLREMELEVNIQRKEMTWQERTAALTLLHEIRMKQDPNWNQTKTSALTGITRQADVSEAIKITKMAEIFPEIYKAKSKRQALSWMQTKASNLLRVDEVKNNKVDFANIEDKIILGDSVDTIKLLAPEMFHAIITDPPFGINYDSYTAGQANSASEYKDDKKSYERLLTMAPELYRVLKPDGWLIWFLGISWYERCKTVFREAGFTVDEIPIIWDRTNERPFTTQPDKYFGRSYDIALHCFKGNPNLARRGESNIIKVPPVPPDEKGLLVERPVELYAELIRRLTIPKESVADFFVGSGSCMAAAAMLGRNYFGVELNAERRAYAIKKIHAYSPAPA